MVSCQGLCYLIHKLKTKIPLNEQHTNYKKALQQIGTYFSKVN